MDNKESQKPDTEQNQNYENYEKNLKLQLESSRKDLDIMLASVIPNQLSLVRMYLWFNASIFGGLVAIFANQLKHLYAYDICTAMFYILLFFANCVFVIIGCWRALSAINAAKYRMFPKDMREELSKTPTNSLEHVNGLNRLISATLDAKNENQKIIEQTAQALIKSHRFIRISLILAIIFGTFTLYLNLMKGGENMADDKDSKPVAMTGTTKPIDIRANSVTIITESVKPHTESKDKPQQESEKSDKKDK